MARCSRAGCFKAVCSRALDLLLRRCVINLHCKSCDARAHWWNEAKPDVLIVRYGDFV